MMLIALKRSRKLFQMAKKVFILNLDFLNRKAKRLSHEFVMCFFRVNSFGLFRIKIYMFLLGSGASLTNGFILGKESSVFSMTNDPSDPGLLILIRIIP